MSRNSAEPMWGRLAACGRLSIGLSKSAQHREWPVHNRPQAASLPHIGSCSFHVDSEIHADIRSSESRHGTHECVRHGEVAWLFPDRPKVRASVAFRENLT